MRCKIRYISRQRRGVTQSDQIVDIQGARLKLGRGTDSDVFLKDLRVNYHHADIVVRESDIVIEAVGASLVRVDGSPVERGVIRQGSEVEVGPYRVDLAPNEPGVDLTLLVELVVAPPADVDLINPARVRIGVTGGTSRRVYSWSLFGAAIVGCLFLPVVAYLSSGSDAGEDSEPIPVLSSFDQVWLSGEMSGSHKYFAHDCGECHEQAFTQVLSEACADCHATIQHHYTPEDFQFVGVNPVGCAKGCHAEHQGPDGVIPGYQSLCAECHENLQETHETELLNLADFGDDHPQFRPSVIVDPAGEGQVERVSLDAGDFPRERSNLRFPHDIHLARDCDVESFTAPETIRVGGTEDKAIQECSVLQMAEQRMDLEMGLDCGDCHRLEAGGINMLPVNMDDHCADCHTLGFDEAAPGRVLPHGEPDEVIAVVKDFYFAKALREADPNAPAMQVLQNVNELRFRPGRAAGRAPVAEVRTEQGPSLAEEAVQVSDEKLRDIFGRTLCGVCHEIIAPGESVENKWEVRPVKVAELWMPKARFDHLAHETSECTDCHEAYDSAEAYDVLMPKIEVCQDCHLGEHANDKLPSTCIMCHEYHLDHLQPMIPHPVETATVQ